MKQAGDWPKVLVQLPVYNEGAIVRETLTALARLDYPAGKLTIQVLDDSTDDTRKILEDHISALPSSGPRIEYIHRADRNGFKAGALANGLSIDSEKSEFVAIFDADFLPERDFLRRTIPAFSQADLAFVQTRWSHRNGDESLLARLMAAAIDSHFSIEQGGRHAANCFINFNGTAGVWRIAAIESAGGWSADSLTEDLDLSFRAQIKGWKSRYLFDVQTPAEVPGTMAGIRSQQHRWTKGAAEVFGKLVAQLWRSEASWRAKVVGTMQLAACLQYVAVVLIGFAALVAEISRDAYLLGIQTSLIAMLNITTLVFVMSFMQSKQGPATSQVRETVSNICLALVFVLFATGFSLQNAWAVLQGLTARKTEFVRTPKGERQKPPLGQKQRVPWIFYVEAILAVAFCFGAVAEMALPHRGNTGLFLLLAFFGTSYVLMVVATSLEIFFRRPTLKLADQAGSASD